MKTRQITCIAVLVCILTMAVSVLAISSTVEETTYTKSELTTLIIEQKDVKHHAHNMAESARALGWSEEDELIKELQETWYNAHNKENKYQNQLNIILIKEESKYQEYPVAGKIWKHLKAQGYNDYVCAGILGNIMTEAGGQSLNINPNALSPDGYYGICQWNRGYGIHNTDLNTQLNFLISNIEYEFDAYGYKYQSGFNFNSFLNLVNAKQAAKAFAICYERCSSSSYSIRQTNAIKAYNYFVGE